MRFTSVSLRERFMNDPDFACWKYPFCFLMAIEEINDAIWTLDIPHTELEKILDTYITVRWGKKALIIIHMWYKENCKADEIAKHLGVTTSYIYTKRREVLYSVAYNLAYFKGLFKQCNCSSETLKKPVTELNLRISVRNLFRSNGIKVIQDIVDKPQEVHDILKSFKNRDNLIMALEAECINIPDYKKAVLGILERKVCAV